VELNRGRCRSVDIQAKSYIDERSASQICSWRRALLSSQTAAGICRRLVQLQPGRARNKKNKKRILLILNFLFLIALAAKAPWHQVMRAATRSTDTIRRLDGCIRAATYTGMTDLFQTSERQSRGGGYAGTWSPIFLGVTGGATVHGHRSIAKPSCCYSSNRVATRTRASITDTDCKVVRGGDKGGGGKGGGGGRGGGGME